MTVSISQRIRRLVAEAVCNKDEAETFCNSLEAGGGAANGATLYATVTLPAFANAGDDLANFPLFSMDVGVTLESVGILADDVYTGIDASNTIVVAVKDQAGNTIVTKTFDDSTVPTDSGADDLGTLNGTHKVLVADELCKISITNGATALPPGLTVLLTFHVT